MPFRSPEHQFGPHPQRPKKSTLGDSNSLLQMVARMFVTEGVECEPRELEGLESPCDFAGGTRKIHGRTAPRSRYPSPVVAEGEPGVVLGSHVGGIEDMEGYYRIAGQSFDGTPSWSMVDEILLAAKSYQQVLDFDACADVPPGEPARPGNCVEVVSRAFRCRGAVDFIFKGGDVVVSKGGNSAETGGHRMAAPKQSEELAYVVTVPRVSALELGQSDLKSDRWVLIGGPTRWNFLK